jgi:hypothetical protein
MEEERKLDAPAPKQLRLKNLVILFVLVTSLLVVGAVILNASGFGEPKTITTHYQDDQGHYIDGTCTYTASSADCSSSSNIP